MSKLPYLLSFRIVSNNVRMEHSNAQPIISPLIEHLMPEALISEKEVAQGNLDAFMEVMYRIYQRLEAEGRFSLPEKEALTKSENMQ